LVDWASNCHAEFVISGKMVGPARFELTTSCTP
jgi:hypothetical protein